MHLAVTIEGWPQHDACRAARSCPTLLPQPGRTDGNYRSYDNGGLGRLSFIRRARDLDFPLAEVREIAAAS